MNKISAKLLSVLAILLFIAVMPIVVFATNEDVSVVSTQNESGKQEYIIYIKGYTDKNVEFKYAFTNIENPEEMDLSYINSISDLGENKAAFLDAATYEKLKSNTIYMWAKDNEGNLILEGIQLDLENSLTKEDINTVETVTKRIEVKIADSEDKATEVRNENIDGVEETASVGYVQIIDDVAGNTIVSASTLDKEVKNKHANIEAAKEVGTLIAKRASEKNRRNWDDDNNGKL